LKVIKAFLRTSVRSYGKKYDYNVDYLIYVVNASVNAGLRVSVVSLISGYRGPKEAGDVWGGALYASTLHVDCGSCAQLVAAIAAEAGVDPDKLQLCAQGRLQEAGNVGLGFQFAQAVLSESPDTARFRDEIHEKFGRKAVVSAALAAAAGGFYPLLKRSLSGFRIM
jgi:hypothetical protein